MALFLTSFSHSHIPPISERGIYGSHSNSDKEKINVNMNLTTLEQQ